MKRYQDVQIKVEGQDEVATSEETEEQDETENNDIA